MIFFNASLVFSIGTKMATDDPEKLRQRLDTLLTLHRDLDATIQALGENRPIDQIQIQRLKKRKLKLKDQIARIRNDLLPDIIA